jgi:anti-sigma regulatory factor (Ser/Thr protein kinase)/CheY-like chemotaxis protein
MARLLVVGQAPDDDLVSRMPGLQDLQIERVSGGAAALQRLADKPFDVLLLGPSATVEEALAFLQHARTMRPGIRAIFLADSATPEAVLASLRAEVFAVFTRPFDPGQIANLIAKAAEVSDTDSDIRVIGAAPHWVTLRVSAHLATADRVVAFMDELHRRLFSDDDMDQLLLAFRELLLNAIEHGAGFDPDKDVRVDAVRSRRALTFYVRDPGPGFSQANLTNTASEDDPLSHMQRRLDAGLRPGGYGLLLSRKLVDEVIYNHTGNEVLLIKHLD